jgi:hypothetical protein
MLLILKLQDAFTTFHLLLDLLIAVEEIIIVRQVIVLHNIQILVLLQHSEHLVQDPGARPQIVHRAAVAHLVHLEIVAEVLLYDHSQEVEVIRINERTSWLLS